MQRKLWTSPAEEEHGDVHVAVVGPNEVVRAAMKWQVLLANYAACGLLRAVAGLVLSGTVNAADLSLANILLLPSVAAVVIGGTSIFGGSGSYSGTIVGALILTVLNSVLTLLDVPDAVKQILYGAIIVVLAAAYTRVLGHE